MELTWEDNLEEWKTEGDLKDLLKTMVAFANSVAPGHVAAIWIGGKDDRTIQGVKNPDSIQKTVRETADKIYPPILWKSFVVEKEGHPCIRIEIEYDGATPHFGGVAWIRKGSETIKATDEIFQKLIELRNSKIRLLSEWLGKEVTVRSDEGSIVPTDPHGMNFAASWTGYNDSILIEANRFWVTVQPNNGVKRAHPISKVILSFDHAKQRLELRMMYSGSSS